MLKNLKPTTPGQRGTVLISKNQAPQHCQGVDHPSVIEGKELAYHGI